MLTTEEVAKLLDTTRSAVNKMVRSGRAIGVKITSGYRLPKWQFDQPLWDALEPLALRLATTNGWAILSFLESSHGGLDGKTPRQAIEQGLVERVMQLAQDI